MPEEYKGHMKELYRRLNAALLSGYIDKCSYNVGSQLLHIMVTHKTLNFAFTWRELTTRAITIKGRMVADTAPSTHFELYGALQQLENRLGIVTHVTQSGILEHIERGRAMGELYHITGEPGVDSHVIQPDTTVFCVYEFWVGSTLSEDIAEYLRNIPQVVEYPRWLLA